MFKKLAGLTAIAGLFVMGTAGAGTIVGSAHDFSDGLDKTGVAGGDTWSSENAVGGEICIVCHAPHNNQNATGDTLWNHDPSSGPFTAYSSPTIDATGGAAVNGGSLLCLSCHDGTIALDSYGGGSGAGANLAAYDATVVVDSDLSNDHPIGIDMADAIAQGDATLADPTAPADSVTLGDGTTGLIADLMLSGGLVQCSSCHDPHNTTSYTAAVGTNRLLRIDNEASNLCRACHNK